MKFGDETAADDEEPEALDGPDDPSATATMDPEMAAEDEAHDTTDEAGDEEPAAASAETVWGRVEDEVEVRGLTATEQVVGHLQPGQWYAIVQTGNGWAHVISVDGALEGWADDRRIIRNT